jgi:hypothetical protein
MGQQTRIGETGALFKLTNAAASSVACEIVSRGVTRSVNGR